MRSKRPVGEGWASESGDAPRRLVLRATGSRIMGWDLVVIVGIIPVDGDPGEAWSIRGVCPPRGAGERIRPA